MSKDLLIEECKAKDIYSEEVATFLKSWSAVPRSIQIEPTRRCNLRCSMCALTHEVVAPSPDITLETFKNIVSQVSKSVRRVTIQGTGEPLVNKDLIEMIKFAKSLGIFYTHFNSNLVLLTKEKADALIDCGHNILTFSIETVNPTKYSDIRRGAELHTVLNNLDYLYKRKKKLKKPLPKIDACCVMMKYTLNDLPKLFKMLQGYGIKTIVLSDLAIYSRSKEISFRDGSKLKDQKCSTEDHTKIIGMTKKFPGITFILPPSLRDKHLNILKSSKNKGILTCEHLWYRPYVMTPGRFMTPCCWTSQIIMGNPQQESFSNIWWGQQYTKLRLQHLTEKHPKFCLGCQKLQHIKRLPNNG